MDSYDLQIYQGTTFSLSLTLKDDNGYPINLSGSQVSGYVKFRYSDSQPMLNLNPAISSPASGIISLNIAANATTGLIITIAPYDIQIINTGNGVVTKALKGNAFIYPDVS
jgi:hypothetical protein